MEVTVGQMVRIKIYEESPTHWVEAMTPLMGALVIVSRIKKIKNNAVVKVENICGDRVIWNFHEDDFEEVTGKRKLSLNKATELLSMYLGEDVEIEV